ncbi:hypothetical protein ACFW9N_23740 [Streptomyces sp. NPDC059496]
MAAAGGGDDFVEDQMDLEIRRHFLVDLGQELLELGGLRELLCPPLPGQ